MTLRRRVSSDEQRRGWRKEAPAGFDDLVESEARVRLGGPVVLPVIGRPLSVREELEVVPKVLRVDLDPHSDDGDDEVDGPRVVAHGPENSCPCQAEQIVFLDLTFEIPLVNVDGLFAGSPPGADEVVRLLRSEPDELVVLTPAVVSFQIADQLFFRAVEGPTLLNEADLPVRKPEEEGFIEIWGARTRAAFGKARAEDRSDDGRLTHV